MLSEWAHIIQVRSMTNFYNIHLYDFIRIANRLREVIINRTEVNKKTSKVILERLYFLRFIKSFNAVFEDNRNPRFSF